MPTYKTPGVYVEEISTFPPSVAEVSTAVPAFIGYTEKGPPLQRVNTLLEYEEVFGGAQPSRFTVRTAGGEIEEIEHDEDVDPAYLMYYCVSHYFKNGGGSCYVISIGNYSWPPSPPVTGDFEAGLRLLEKEDEPTLILLTDAVHLAAADYFALCQQALTQCDKLGDRFALLDVQDGDVDGFRDQTGTNHLMYGAAYHPYLLTSLSYRYRDEDVTIEASRWQGAFGEDGIVVRYEGDEGAEAEVRIVSTSSTHTGLTFAVTPRRLEIYNVEGETGSSVAEAWAAWADANDPAGFAVAAGGDGTGVVPNTGGASTPLARDTAVDSLASIKSTETALYHQVKTALAAEKVVLPPSAAVAGIYASVDRDRGVWKAPANVSVSSVIGPVTKVTHDDQESLNVDPTGGKSINAIRAFTGKGTLVWGARTLAGNDNEWRYVPVRRLFNMIEESTHKATSFAVFEPNDMTTWLKVKGMIESYLYGLWEQGALAGPTPESAYFVHVGLGKTMTAQDVLEGRMIVEIGVAAVRPAEFIILRFTHKLQEA